MLPETEVWLRSAIDLGVDAIGGVPAFSDQPIAFLKLLFEMAQRSGLPLDLHIDEHLDETKLLFDELAQMTRAWAARHGFTLFPDEGYESVTLTCINNGAKPGGRTVDVAKLQKLVKDQGFLIDGGYGKIKGTTFRISNMGDETETTMNQLFAALDGAMRQLSVI